MPRIHISELRPAGSKLFEDSESFLDELKDGDIPHIKGGLTGLELENYLRNLYGIAPNGVYAGRYGSTIFSARGNSVNNNTFNAQSINARSIGNYNTIASI